MHWQWGFQKPKILKNAKKANVWIAWPKNWFLQQDIEVSIVKKMSKTVYLCHDYDSIKCQITNTGSASFDKTFRSLCCWQSDGLRTKRIWKKQWIIYNAFYKRIWNLDLLRNLSNLLCKNQMPMPFWGDSPEALQVESKMMWIHQQLWFNACVLMCCSHPSTISATFENLTWPKSSIDHRES